AIGHSCCGQTVATDLQDRTLKLLSGSTIAGFKTIGLFTKWLIARCSHPKKGYLCSQRPDRHAPSAAAPVPVKHAFLAAPADTRARGWGPKAKPPSGVPPPGVCPDSAARETTPSAGCSGASHPTPPRPEERRVGTV